MGNVSFKFDLYNPFHSALILRRNTFYLAISGLRGVTGLIPIRGITVLLTISAQHL